MKLKANILLSALTILLLFPISAFSNNIKYFNALGKEVSLEEYKEEAKIYEKKYFEKKIHWRGKKAHQVLAKSANDAARGKVIKAKSYDEKLTPEKKAAIKELLQITGAKDMGKLFSNTFTQQMIQVLKNSRPDINPKAFDIIKEIVDKVIHEELVEKESYYPYMYPVYHKYLTLEETKGLAKFYKTHLGRKLVAVMPKLTLEGMKAGQVWGQSVLAPKFQQRLLIRFQKEGISVD